MDVDNDPIDSNLLLQFGCLNTSDRDDLVKQFKELIEEVNDDAAYFFLEMSNWNLQNAICAFLDYRSPSDDISMTVVQEPPQCNSLRYTPNIDVSLWYTIGNDGKEAWPQGCFLKPWCGNYFFSEKIPVSAVEPGSNTCVIFDFKAPAEPGQYHSSFRLSTPSGTYFGRVLNIGFQVVVKLEDLEEQRLSDELASRMALIDMEEEPNTESPDIVVNPLNSSIEIDQRNVTDYNQKDHNIS